MRTLILLLLTSLAALAADATGTWKATAEGPMGSMQRTFVFKVDGDKLTGETTSDYAGKSEIKNGSVKNGELTFTIHVSIQGNDLDVTYKGKFVNDDELKLTGDAAGNTIEWTAKRQK